MHCLSHPTVNLHPVGEIRVCMGRDQQFLCTSGGVTWDISGFDTGISDTNSPMAAVIYALRNSRVISTDNSTVSNPSSLTFMMLGYADDNAVVTCVSSTLTMRMTSTIRIGESAFNIVQTGNMWYVFCNCKDFSGNTAQKEGNSRKRTSDQDETRDLQSFKPRAISPSRKSFISHCLMYWVPSSP